MRASASVSGAVTPRANQSPTLRNLEAATDGGGGGNDHDNDDDQYDDRYYYSALVHLSQWNTPRITRKSDLSRVVEATFTSVPSTGGRLLEANPHVKDMLEVQTMNHRYIAAAVALLMRYDPRRLSQFDALRRQYSISRDVEYARGGGDDGHGHRPPPLNAKKLYSDLLSWYGRMGSRGAHNVADEP